MRQHIRQQAQFPQHLQSGRLQQEARADRPQCFRLLEDLHAVAVTRQQQCRGLASGAVTDDGDMQGVHRMRRLFPAGARWA
ncbi:hypothetical protein D9M70_623540 [compost metagenome]